MTTRSFLALSLALPLVCGLVAWFLPGIADPFAASFLVGAIPYIPFAVVLAYLIKRSASMRNLVVLSLLAPCAFALWLITVYFMFSLQFASPLAETIRESAYFATFALAFGYFYVALAWALWAVAKRMRFVRNEFAT